MAQSYDLPGPPNVPTLSFVSVVPSTYLAQVFQLLPQTGLGHLFSIPTCLSEGTNVNRIGTLSTAPRRRKLRFPWGLISSEVS